MTKKLNWIERRARCERMLSKHAMDIWESVRTAIDDCCTSFEQCYGDRAVVSKTTENGHRIRVSVAHNINSMRKNVSVELEPEKNEIVVTVDGGSANRFQIKADEEHAFLSHQGQEISPERFTEIALEDALFKAPTPRPYNEVPRGDSPVAGCPTLRCAQDGAPACAL